MGKNIKCCNVIVKNSIRPSSRFLMLLLFPDFLVMITDQKRCPMANNLTGIVAPFDHVFTSKLLFRLRYYSGSVIAIPSTVAEHHPTQQHEQSGAVHCCGWMFRSPSICLCDLKKLLPLYDSL